MTRIELPGQLAGVQGAALLGGSGAVPRRGRGAAPLKQNAKLHSKLPVRLCSLERRMAHRQDNSEVKTGLEEAHRGWFNSGVDSLVLAVFGFCCWSDYATGLYLSPGLSLLLWVHAAWPWGLLVWVYTMFGWSLVGSNSASVGWSLGFDAFLVVVLSVSSFGFGLWIVSYLVLDMTVMDTTEMKEYHLETDPWNGNYFAPAAPMI
ncbi:hypothetical protein TEA_001992 [Camellia sinensis var. sinensis]|uniref:Uncharacterized protein n=1 Tax=Camellia sinensis var. sinensis TaxID=542762 RepID=A0A4S4E005_CAMSN|nr:hypothetical protein TEA_001992 [Camellia sinensis var. sinensis]